MNAFTELFRGLRILGRIWGLARGGKYIIRRPRLAARQRLRREAMKHRKTPPVRAGKIFFEGKKMNLKEKLRVMLDRLPAEITDDVVKFAVDRLMNHDEDFSYAICEAVAAGIAEAARERVAAKMKGIIEAAGGEVKNDAN